MDHRIKNRLRREVSGNDSGRILDERFIPLIKERDYLVDENRSLDGDAPKQFIRVYSYEEGGPVRRAQTKSWIPYIAKTGEKWYPHESVTEYMINRFGQELGLVMNELALCRINGQIRFLSRYFLQPTDALIHGAEIFGEHLQDMEFAKEIADDKSSAREFFTFEFLCEALEASFPSDHKTILLDIVRMLVFDGLIGNNDRHFYNWAVVRSVNKKSNREPRLAPLYDSSRAMLWNLSDNSLVTRNAHLQRNSPHAKMERYINEACPRISIEEDKGINHFKLIAYLKAADPEFAPIVDRLSTVDQEHKLLRVLTEEFNPLFCQDRLELITHIIQRRFQYIRDL